MKSTYPLPEGGTGDPAPATHEACVAGLLIELYPEKSPAHFGVHRPSLVETMYANHTYNDITAPMVVLDGPMDDEAFHAYVCTCLCPTLHPGDVVIADNLLSHKVAGVRDAIEVAGATRRYLPPTYPPPNPIEKLSSKLKTLLRKAAKRSVDALWKEIGRLLHRFSPGECTNYFQSTGYHA